MRKRTADFETRMKAYQLQQKEIQREMAIIERYRSFNREKSIKAAESRQKRLDRIERLDKPVEEQNELIANMTGETVAVDKSLELFERADGNMLECWLVMLGFCLVCCVISAVVLRRVAKDSR